MGAPSCRIKQQTYYECFMVIHPWKRESIIHEFWFFMIKNSHPILWLGSWPSPNIRYSSYLGKLGQVCDDSKWFEAKYFRVKKWHRRPTKYLVITHAVCCFTWLKLKPQFLLFFCRSWHFASVHHDSRLLEFPFFLMKFTNSRGHLGSLGIQKKNTLVGMIPQRKPPRSLRRSSQVVTFSCLLPHDL